MKDLTIRKFKPGDVEDFIRLSKISFAEETRAEGITPEDFEQETRRIFRWNMLPYKLLTALMGIQWEGFVAEKDEKIVGGGMYIGRNHRMTITNLMVDPAYRRQGIGQALLIHRLERMKERGFPFALAQVLDTNIASLQNLKKQNFEVFNQFSVYERILPLPNNANSSSIQVRDIQPSDKPLFLEIERQIINPFTLQVKGSDANQYFPSPWQKFYNHFAGYSKWVKNLIAFEKPIGFLNASFQAQQQKGLLLQPIITAEGMQFLPTLIGKTAKWLESAGRQAIMVEIPHHQIQIRDYLLENGWERQFTWIELIRWLDGEEEGRKLFGHIKP